MIISNVTGNFFLKQNDTATEIHLAISEVDGTPIPLDTATRVEVVIGTLEGRMLVKTPTLLPKAGELTFGLDEGDRLPVGDNLLEVHIHTASGEKRVAPSKGHYKLKVQQAMDNLDVVVTTYTLDYFLSEVNRITYGLPEIVERAALLADEMDALIADSSTLVDQSTTALAQSQAAKTAAESALATSTGIIASAGTNAVRAENAAIAAEQATAQANPAAAAATLAAQQANDARDNANVAASLADGLATDLQGYNAVISNFSLGTTYLKHQHVRSNGSTYRAKVATTGNPLPVLPAVSNTWFELVAQKGDTGLKGDTGTGINLKGAYATIEELPAAGNVEGDAYTVNGFIYVWDGAGWQNGGNIKGEQGIQGEKGDPFLYEDFTPQQLEALRGPQGIQGIQGIQGPAGQDADVAPIQAQVDNHESRLTSIEGGAVTTKADVAGLNREVAYLKLKQDAGERIEGGTVFADDMKGSRFGFELKTAKTVTNVPLALGETVLTDKIGAIENGTIAVGSKVTVMDATNTEQVTVTRSEVITTVTPFTANNAAVVASAYSTAGNGGRKLVRLDNGWLVAATRDSNTVKYYVSKDNGNVWTFLASIGPSSNVDFTFEVVGTKIYHFGTLNAGSSVPYVIFDAIANEGAAFIAQTGTVDAGQTALGNVTSVLNENKNEIHLAWASKNATSPNSFGIRYAKGTINGDGSVTWSAVETVTTYNATGNDVINPSIKVLNGEVLICFAQVFTTNRIQIFTYKSNAWTQTDIYDGGTYVQNSPSITVSKDNVLHVAWHGKDSIHTATDYIRYYNRSNGSGYWSNTKKLVAGTNASITTDKNGHIFITYETAGSTYYIKSTDNGTTWSTAALVATGSNPSTLEDSSLVYTVPPTVQMGASNVVFNGNWATSIDTYHLECSPLTKAYTANAIIAESTMNPDGTFMDALEMQTNSIVNKTVVSSAYSTAGNGGRRIVKLDNGWLVTVTKNISNLTAYMFISKDNGVTFSPFGAINYPLGVATDDIVLSTFNNKVYVLRSWKTGLASSVLDSSGTQVVASNPDVDQTIYGGLTLTIDPANGHLHAAWASKNATYPNSFNIRYSKSIDGGVTWSAVEQITSINNSSQNVNGVSIVIKDGSAVIVGTSNTSGEWRAVTYIYNGSSWTSKLIHNGTALYQQNSPSTAKDKNGTIHVVWHGYDATHASTYYVRYSKSIDGGNTWSAIQKLVVGQNASISVNADGHIFISYESGANLKTHVSTDNGTTWTDSGVTVTGTSPSALDDSSLDFTVPLTVAMGASSVLFNGSWSAIEEVPKLTATATYAIPSTDYVGAFVEKAGDVTATAYLNDTLMASEQVGNEYQFVGSLATESPVTLQLELSRDFTVNGKNDRISRILGGRS